MKIRQLTHESEQREMRLAIKLDQKADELKRVTENAVERQREFDAIYEQLRQERDDLKLERDTWNVEYNKVLAMHEKKTEKHRVEMEIIQRDSQEKLADLNQRWQLDLAAWQQDKQRFEQEATRLSEELLSLRQQIRQADVTKSHLVSLFVVC